MSSFTKKTRSLLQTSSQRCDIFLTATVCSITLLLFLPLLPYFLNGNDTNLAKNIDRVRLKIVIGSFWCLYLFGVCDGIDHRILPTYDHCIHIQNNTCYQIVEKALERKSLPLECSDFEVNSTNCNKLYFKAITSHIKYLHVFLIVDNNISRNLSSYKNISCSEQFYFDKMSLTCKPECGVWTLLPSIAAVTLRVFFIVINAIGLVGCIAVFVLTWVNRKRL